MGLRRLLLVALLAVHPVSLGADELPPFPDITLIGSGGETVPVRSLFGGATVVNFWATWCGPCRVELPELQRMNDDLAGKGLAVLAVNVDSPRALVPRFLERGGITLDNYFVDAETERSLGIPSVPTTLLIDSEGRVVQVYVGYSKEGMLDLRQRAEGLLAGQGGQGGS